jgi:hypothetical protein
MAKAPLYSPGPSPEPFAVTPTDTATTLFDNESRYFYVGTGGTVILVTRGGVEISYTNVPNGGYVWASALRVKATGTTASAIIGHP